MKKYYLKNYNRFVNLIWLAIGIMFTIQFGVRTLPIHQAMLVAISVILVSYPLTTHLSTKLLRKAMQRNRMFDFAIQFLAYSAITGLFLFLVLWLFTYLERMGVFPISTAFGGNDTLFEDLASSMVTALFFNFGFCGLRFYEENLRLQKNLIESQLQILQAQINPHFMFNVLNHVHVLIKKEPDLADSLLLQYTDILRYQLYSGKKEHITIEQEVQFLKNFIDVEKVRWKNKLDIRCTWNVEDNNMEFPPLLLITFIENAFKHVSRSSMEKGYVNIDFKQKGETVRLMVENSDSGIKPSGKDDSGIGLINIKKRLDIIFPDKYSLETTRNDIMYSTKLTINI